MFHLRVSDLLRHTDDAGHKCEYSDVAWMAAGTSAREVLA
jgi:hypothetical protein